MYRLKIGQVMRILVPNLHYLLTLQDNILAKARPTDPTRLLQPTTRLQPSIYIEKTDEYLDLNIRTAKNTVGYETFNKRSEYL